MRLDKFLKVSRLIKRRTVANEACDAPYLDFAENMTLRHIPLTMQDWEKRLNSFIEMFDYGILQDAGKVSAEIAKLHAETEFEKYRVIQDSLFMSDFDRYMLELEESAKK